MGIFNRMNRDLSKMPDTATDMDDLGSARIGRPVYYYVGAMYNGTPVVLGRYYTYEQAENMGRRKLGDTPLRIYPKTCDMRTATKEIKYDLLNQNNIEDVMRRAKHVIEPEEEGI